MEIEVIAFPIFQNLYQRRMDVLLALLHHVYSLSGFLARKYQEFQRF